MSEVQTQAVVVSPGRSKLSGVLHLIPLSSGNLRVYLQHLAAC